MKQGSDHQLELTSSIGSTSEGPRNETDASSAVRKSWSVATSDSNMDSLAMQIQNWQSLGSGGREASPDQRPRSNSGRLLSDEVWLESKSAHLLVSYVQVVTSSHLLSF